MYRRGVELTHQWVNINILTGDLGDRTINTLPQTPSVLAKHTAITYDFYQAGPGKAGLPNQCQCYVTVTINWGVMDGGMLLLLNSLSKAWVRVMAPQIV